jgi:hypothetical protein
MIDPQVQQQLLDAKDKQIELLESIVEQRRLTLMYQSKELADLREYHHVNKQRWGFFWYLVLSNVWPFSIWYHRFEN